MLLIRTKFSRPPKRPAFVERTRLLDRLDEALEFFSAVDAMDTPRFQKCLAADMKEVFGEQVEHGIDAITKAFYALDGDFVTKHNVTAVWKVENAFIMQGSADLTKKGTGPETTSHLAPLINVFWLNEQGKIASHVVTFPPAAKPAGYKG